MSIAVTGASGPLGRATAQFLLQRVDPAELVLITRSPDALADLAETGAEVRRGTFAEPSSLAEAFRDVDRLLLISTDAVGGRLGQHRAAIAAAAEAGVQHVVYTSVPEPVSSNPALVVADHAGTEQTLRDSGLRWTSLRNNLYSHMQVPGLAGAAKSGQLVTNSGAGLTAYVTRENCAETAAAVLTSNGHEGQSYDVTGPEAVSAEEMAILASKIEGREVTLIHVDDAAFYSRLRDNGFPDEAARLVTSFGAATRQGFLSNVSTTVAELTGKQPTSLGEVVRAATA